MPALIIILTLENYISEVSCLNNSQNSSNNDLVTFVLSLLLGNDEQAKSWFSFLIRQEVSDNIVINIDELYNNNYNILLYHGKLFYLEKK